MAATELVNYLNTYKKRNHCKYLFKGNTVPLKTQDYRKWSPEIMMVALKCIAASATSNTSYMQFMVARALLINSGISLRFLYVFVSAAVCYFSVYKLIGGI